MDKIAKIVVLGSANGDLYVELSRLPVEGETIPAIAGGELRPGGKGANTAAAASLMKACTWFLGQMGKDAAGQMLSTELSHRGVNLNYVNMLDSAPTGQAVVMLLPGGQNSIIIIGGANQAWNTLPASMYPAIDNADALMLQREVPDSINLQAALYARSKGKLVILDAGGKLGPVSDELLGAIDVLSPNSVEIEEISGVKGNVDEAARVLIEKGVKHVIVKLSAEGSLYVGSEGRHQQSAFKVSGLEIVDTTGAGDCFTAALVTRLVELGQLSLLNFQQAMAFASVAAFLSITKKGAMESIPGRDAVDAQLNI